MIIRRRSIQRRMSTYERMYRLERMLHDSRLPIGISETKTCLSKNAVKNFGDDKKFDCNKYRTAAAPLSIKWNLSGLLNVDSIGGGKRRRNLKNIWWLSVVMILMSLLFGVIDGANGNSVPYTVQIGTMMRAQNGRVQRVIVEQIRNISEGIKPGPSAILATYQAYDHRPGDLMGTNFTFRINRTTDPERQFYIGPKDGILKVAKPLDREKTPAYRLVIEAVDEANNVGHTILVVNLEDVNDNAPELNVSRIPVIPENKGPNLWVALVTAFDRDTPENGPPFFMASPSNSTYNDKFNFNFLQGADQGRGAMNITTKVIFDREKDGKRLDIPIYVRDSGKPPMDAIRFFPVIIGDENDNPMTDGYSVIQVYNYDRKMPVTSIGRAYVEDLDDWDIVDKTFEWQTKAPAGFSLAPDGIITIDPLSYDLASEYTLKITVKDNKRKETATATVKVLIDVISPIAFNSAGSIRIKWIEAEDFIRKFPNDDSQYNKLRKFLSEKLAVPQSNVPIFSVMSEGRYPPIIQVYFAVRGSMYKSATYLNGILSQNRDELEKLLGRGAQITQVNVDDCVFESCEYGCVRVASADIKPTVLNANETSLVGVTTSVFADCGRCAVPAVPRECSPNPCQNGGLCHKAEPGVFCECRGDFHGPFCEGRMRTFGGKSYAWLDPIKPCTKLHIRFEFMTTSNNALLLYDGPMAAARDGDYYSSDYIAVEILNNKPALLLDLGHGLKYVRMNIAPDVNDGQWHTIDIVFNAQDFTMTLDGCSNTKMPIINGNQNESDCQVVGMVPNDYEQLNVIDPLQIGGLATSSSSAYPSLNVTTGLDGCLRNIYINEVLQDLGSPPNAVASEAGCSRTDSVCLANLEPVCVHGICVSSMNDKNPRCVCDPGYVGDRCDKNFVWRNFDQNSYVAYTFKDNMPMSSTSMSLRMIIAPRKQDGILFRGTSTSGNGFVQTEMDAFALTYRNSMGTNVGFRGPLAGEETTLALPSRLNASQPYLVDIRRELTFVKLAVDGMPSPFTVMAYEKNAPLDFDRSRFFVGAQSENAQGSADYQGCIGQILYDDRPLPVSQSDAQTFAEVTGQKSVTDGCPDVATCASVNLGCPPNYVCVDFWKGPFCTCPPEMKPLFNEDGIWINCGEPTAALRLGITNGAVAAILICLLVLLILVLLLVVYSRRRRVIREPSPYSDVRENIINYAEEGGGEEDQDRYNIAPLRKPVLPTDDFRQQHAPPVSNGRPTTPPDANMEDLIRDRVRLADTDPTAPPYDELRAYADEDAMSVGSLSSLSSDEEEDVEWDALNTWGPRFRKLADLYASQD